MTIVSTLALHHQECEHAPNYMKGCIPCCVRYVKFLRPSREKQNTYLARLPETERETVLEILKRERVA